MLLCIEQKDNIQCALTPNKKINLMVAIRKLFILYYLYVICRFFVHWIFSGFKGFHSDEGGQMPSKIQWTKRPTDRLYLTLPVISLHLSLICRSIMNKCNTKQIKRSFYTCNIITWNDMSPEKPKSISMLFKKSDIIKFNHKGFLLCGRLNIGTFLIINTFFLFNFSIGLLYIWSWPSP